MGPEQGRVSSTNRQMSDASSDELKRDIESTRSKMDETLFQLEQRLKPRSILNETLSYFGSKVTDSSRAAPRLSAAELEVRREQGLVGHETDEQFEDDVPSIYPSAGDVASMVSEAASDFGKGLLVQVKENPLGSALITSGLAYLAFRHSQVGGHHDFQPEGHARRPVGPDAFYDYDPGPELEDDDIDVDVVQDPLLGAPLSHSHAFDPSDGYEPDYADGVDHSIYNSSQLPITSEPEDMSSTHDINRQASQGQPQRRPAQGGNPGHADDSSSMIGSAADSVRSAARSTYLRSRATARDARSAIADSTVPIGARSSELVRQGGEKFNSARNEYPLAMGLGFAALGAIAGLLAPRTRTEDEWMGQQSDAVKDQLRNTASSATSQAAEQGRQAIADVRSTAMGAVSEQGLGTDNLLDRAKHVVQDAFNDGTRSLREAAEKEGLMPGQLKAAATDVVNKTKSVASDHAQHAAADLEGGVKSAAKSAGNKVDEVSNQVQDTAKGLQNAAAQKIDEAGGMVSQAQRATDDLKNAASKGADTLRQSGGTSASKPATGDPNIKVTSDDDLRVEVVDDKTDSDAMEISQNWSDHENKLEKRS